MKCHNNNVFVCVWAWACMCMCVSFIVLSIWWTLSFLKLLCPWVMRNNLCWPITLPLAVFQTQLNMFLSASFLPFSLFSGICNFKKNFSKADRRKAFKACEQFNTPNRKSQDIDFTAFYFLPVLLPAIFKRHDYFIFIRHYSFTG